MDLSHVRTILFVGKPGSGKETQAELLAAKTGFSVFSTGQKFREIREEKTVLGEHVRATLDKGLLLPPWLASYLFQEVILHAPLTQGLIFEGTGRARDEAELFHQVALWLERPYIVFNLAISDEEAVRRQVGRGRADSNTEEKVRVRLNEYNKHTAPVIDFFDGVHTIITIPGERPIEEIHRDILGHLGLPT